MSVNSIVLAGGKGVRLGRNKVIETVGSRSLLQRAVLSLSFLKSEIVIVTATKQPLLQSIDYPKLKVVTDIYPGKGPLGGVYTGLAASDSSYSLVVACDMPFLNQDLLRYMIQVSAGFDLVVPRLGNFVEPLHAVYSRGCLAPIDDMLKQGELSVLELFDAVRVRYVEAEEINRFDPEHLSFFNVNNEADLEKARRLVQREVNNDKC